MVALEQDQLVEHASDHHCKWPPLSPVLLHICQLWQTTAKLLQPLQQLPLQLWKRLSIWGPKVSGVRNISRSATTGSNARLKSAGICVIADITSDGRSTIPLQQAACPELQLTDNISRAYLKITATTPHHAAAYRSASGFATSPSTDPMWVIKLKDETPNDDSQIGHSHATAAFIVSQVGLQPTDLSNVPTEASWNRAPVATFWNSQKRPPLRMLYTWQDNNAVIAGLQWNDQSNFLASSNAVIRRLLTTDTSLATKRLHKWVLSHHLDPDDTTRWTKLWSSHRPIKLSLFQWFILFQALPTNTWRFPKASRTDDVTWCTCCTSRAAEDIEHMLWKCPSVQSIWTWVLDVLYTAFPETRRWSSRFSHAVLGKDIPQYCKKAARWWEAWRLNIIWILWNKRNEKIFRDSTMPPAKAKALAWHRLLLHTREEWKRHCTQADKSDLTIRRRAKLDKKIATKLAIVNLKFRTSGNRVYTSWKPP
ncbi:hypothetical protein R1sor_006825 [Riccia sorocarpa]|uniref:Reverse transcriptase zinc-binding domain-containing protein n=1 Tax=Riccia sorocarpa TaxID=122646 RepID=A0ABD3HRK5_9MARC